MTVPGDVLRALLIAKIQEWRDGAALQSRQRKGLRRNTPANAFKEGVQVASIDHANDIAVIINRWDSEQKDHR